MSLRTLFVALFVSSSFSSFAEGETVAPSYHSVTSCTCVQCAGDALTGSSGPKDFGATALHALMHAVNVAHTSGYDSIMWSQASSIKTLQPADRGALWALYGQRAGTEGLSSNEHYNLGSGTAWPKDPDGIARVSFALDPELEILSPHYRLGWLSATGAVSAVANIEFYELPAMSEPLAVDIFVRPLFIDGPGGMLEYAYYPTGDFIKRYTDERYGDIYFDLTDQWYVANVPEPSTLVLGFGCSMFTLVFYKRRMMRRIRG